MRCHVKVVYGAVVAPDARGHRKDSYNVLGIELMPYMRSERKATVFKGQAQTPVLNTQQIGVD